MAPIKSLWFSLLFATAAYSRCTCVVPPSKGAASSAKEIQDVFDRCSKDAKIVFKKGAHYNAFEPIVAELDNVIISVQGDIHLPQDVPAVQKMVSDAGGSLTWFKISGSNVQWIGSEDINSGWIKSYGQKWWDLNPEGETGTANRPHLMEFDVDNGSMDFFKSSKPVAWGTSIKGSNVTVSNAFIDAVSETSSFPFNTDAFDVSGDGITIQDSVMYNGDDAIAVKSGAHNILFQRNTIGYQTHGMSIGSLGSNPDKFDNVSNIRFNDVTVAGGLYASRFKSWAGGQGSAKDITWSNIRVANVSFPIFITQSYWDQGKENADRPTESSVDMENFKWENFSGSINTFHPGDGSCASDPCWYNVGLPDLKHTESIILECNTDDSCKDCEFHNIQIYPDNGLKSSVICMKAGADLNPDLGIKCQNGTYVPL